MIPSISTRHFVWVPLTPPWAAWVSKPPTSKTATLGPFGFAKEEASNNPFGSAYD